MAGTSLFFDIMARDHASAVFNKVGAAADRLGKQTDRAGKAHSTFGKAVRWAGGMVSLYGAGQFLKSSIQAYADAETAQNRLAASYKRFPAMQNVALESFKDLNTQLMLHTRFDDDDAAAMQANLCRFELSGKQIQRLTPLMADLAQVQGTDLVTAGGNFGKAILGNTRALKALGISYTATGDRGKDLRNIVRLLHEKVGGESAKAATTSAAKMAMLGNQWGELKETVGLAVLPAFSKLATVAGPAITGLQQTVQRNMPQIKQTFEDVCSAAQKLAGIGKGIWDGFSSMPEGTRQLLLALAGGTWAVGKIKGSALGQGIGSIFSAVKGMNVNAGVVNVNGKVAGVPGGGPGVGGVPTSKAASDGILATFGKAAGVLAVNTAIILGLAESIKRNWESTAAWQRDVQASNKARAGGDSRGAGFSTSNGGGIRQPNVPNNSGRLRAEASGFREASTAAKAHADTLNRLTGVDTKWGEAAKSASLKGTVGARAVASAVKSIPDRKASRSSTPGAEESQGRVKGLGGAIGGLKGKTVGVKESGASASQGRVKGLGGVIGALKGKTVKVSEQGASESRTRVQNLGASINALEGTHYIDVVTRYTTTGGGPGKAALKAGGGYISGPGGPTDDAIPARLSNGEFVIRAAAVRKYGRGFLDAVNSGRLIGFRNGTKPKSSAAAKKLTDDQRKAQAQALRQANRENRAASEQYRWDTTDAATQKALAKARIKAAQAAQTRAKTDGARAKAVRRMTKWQDRFRSADQAVNDLAAQQTEADTQATNDAISARDSAWGSLTASRNARAWAAKPAAQQQAEADARVAALNQQIAGTSDPAVLADLYAQLEDAEQKAADAAQAVADSQDAALEKVTQRRDAVDAAARSFRDYGSISTTAVNDVADAQSKLTDANDKVAAAQKKLDLAGSDRERAAAAAELSRALGEQQTAQQNAASAGKPSTGSIRGNMASRLQKIRDFSSAVKALQSQGLNATTLNDILQMGPEQGYDFAKALLDGGLADINELQNQITSESASLGYFSTQTQAASDQLTGAAAAAQIGVTITPAPVTLTLDTQVIASAMIAYQRQMGYS